MDIVCHVSCDPFGHSGDKGEYRGMWTHCRSEGTWVLGVALNMARHGHDVTILGYRWGDTEKYPLPTNIRLQEKVAFDGCDVFIDAGWDDTNAPIRCEAVKAKMYIHAWGGSPFTSSLLKYVNTYNKTNHYMARPSRAFWKEYEKYPYAVYMPTPLIDKIKNKGNFHSHKMLWANRGAFNQDYNDDSQKVLNFMVANPTYKYKVLLWGDVMEKLYQNLFLQKAQETIAKFKALDAELIEPYIGIGHDEFLVELNQSKILLDTAHPAEHPQNLEAVCMGCVPLIWKKSEHHFQYVYESDGRSDNVNELWSTDGPNGLDKILSDEDTYQEYFEALRTTTLDHEYDRAYDILIQQIKEHI